MKMDIKTLLDKALEELVRDKTLDLICHGAVSAEWLWNHFYSNMYCIKHYLLVADKYDVETDLFVFLSPSTVGEAQFAPFTNRPLPQYSQDIRAKIVKEYSLETVELDVEFDEWSQMYWLFRINFETVDQALAEAKKRGYSAARTDKFVLKTCEETWVKSNILFDMFERARALSDDELMILAVTIWLAMNLESANLFFRQRNAFTHEYGDIKLGILHELLSSTAQFLFYNPNLQEIYDWRYEFLNRAVRELEGLSGPKHTQCDFSAIDTPSTNLKLDTDLFQSIIDFGADPAEQFLKKEQLKDLVNAAGFSPGERQVFGLMIQGYSETEIATIMNRKLGTIRSWRSRVIKKLKQAVERLQKERI